MKLPGRADHSGELRPPRPRDAGPGPVKRPMSVGVDSDRFLPTIFGSVRFRIALLYSVLLFGLAALLLGGVYAGLAREIGGEVMAEAGPEFEFRNTDGNRVIVQQLEDFEAEVDRQALADLRRYSFAALAVLFAASMLVGWYVAGIVLKPIERITAVARAISATDLTRRINLKGPDDELGQLAGTFDDMLDRLDMAFNAQTRFIHEASHELRNPLAVIRTNLEVTLSDPDATVEDLRRAGQVVDRSAERMTTLVDELLDHARQETRTKTVEVIDLAHVIRHTAEEFEIPATADEVNLLVDAEENLLVEGDTVALRRALANLLANAIRLAPAGSTILIRAGRVEQWLWMGVQDQGPGLSDSDQQRVFRRFWRGDNTGTHRRDGRSGLGLAIVKQIAETHGGTVRVESELGEGSTFVIWLPSVNSRTTNEEPPEFGSADTLGDRDATPRLLTAPLHPSEYSPK